MTVPPVPSAPPRVWLDTEFSDLLDARLISAAFVAENGAELYLELR
jgi:hypothetical protein